MESSLRNKNSRLLEEGIITVNIQAEWQPVNLEASCEDSSNIDLLVVVIDNDVMGFLVFHSTCRLHTAQRAIKQTQVTVQKFGKEIEEKLRTTATCTERVSTPISNTHRTV